MLTGFLGRAMRSLGVIRGLHDHFTNDALNLEQFQLRVGELFAGRAILLDPHQSQTLFQHANPQFRVLQPALQLGNEFQIGWR
jgi:hypothetical protein